MRRLRIAAVLVSFPPHRAVGAEIATHAVLQELQAAGHEVEVRVSGLVGGAGGSSSGSRSRGGRPPIGWNYDGIKVEPFDVGAWADGGRSGLGRDWDAIVTHPYADPNMVLSIRATGAPVVVLAHSGREYIRKALRTMWPEAALVAPNCWTTWRLLGLDRPEWAGRVAVVRPPVPAPRAGERARKEIARPVIGFVNGTALKGGGLIEELIRKRGGAGGWEFRGAASGYAEELVPELVAAAQVGPGGAGRGREVKQFEPGQMAEFYDGLDVFVQPSFEESWGMAALEALARGVPVVATELLGPREALAGVQSGAGGWVRWVDPGHWAGIERAVEELLGDEERAARAGIEARTELGEVLRGKAAQSAADRVRFVRAFEERLGGA